MKHFNTVIFVLLFLFTLQGDARKVCILYEQKSVPDPTILSEESIVVKREISDLNEDIPVLTEEIPPEINDAVTEEAVTEETVTEETVTEALKEEVLTEEAKTEGISEVTEAVAKLANISVIPRSNNDNLKSNNICALEGITLFDDQNVCNSIRETHYFNESIISPIIFSFIEKPCYSSIQQILSFRCVTKSFNSYH